MKAMILAAGLGTRLRPYSRHTPKALFTINERPVLAIAIAKLQSSGCDAIMVNTHHHHGKIEAFIAGGNFGIPVHWRYEIEILGTGGAIRNVADFWQDDSLLVINADIVCDIDLAQVHAFHQAHGCPVTMVMHDHAKFNSVWVDSQDLVSGFQAHGNQSGYQSLAFTGIHLLERRVLDFLPEGEPSSIIDTYGRMITAGERIAAFVVRGHRWHDIGTPESYRTAVFDHMAPLAFNTAFGAPPVDQIQKQPLQGDGSDRQWYRLNDRQRSLIMVDHGIRRGVETIEVDAFIRIGRHLGACGVAVPQIYAYDRLAGLVFLQDVGDAHLQDQIDPADEPGMLRLYRGVIDGWIAMALNGSKGFDPAWTYQTAHYDAQVVLNNECRYFVEAFVQGYLGWEISFGELNPEFELLAAKIAQTEITGFLHRDFQARNIMVHNERIYFIDFQGGRRGPIQYDLASLLIDPYTNLPVHVQRELLDYGVNALRKHHPDRAESFVEGYGLCALSRNLQILGAFAFLSRTKGKKQFEQYIPRAVDSLVRNLACLKGISLPKLEQVAAGVQQTIRHM